MMKEYPLKTLDQAAMKEAQRRLDALTKPLGSLGRLEEMIIRLAGIRGTAVPSVKNKNMLIFCADNGVVDEGVSSCPKSVTATVTRNFTRGLTGINVLTAWAGAGITVVDIGVDEDLSGTPGILDRKIRMGTGNLRREPAMTREEAVRGIDTGIALVKQLAEEGVDVFGTGEMGIGNTTTSAAITAVFTGKDPTVLVGRGSGLSDAALSHKQLVVQQALALHQPDPADPVGVLAAVGGLDIAGLAGAYIGAGMVGRPIVIDGFIAAAAALLAVRICPACREFMFPSHGSAEPGAMAVMTALGFRPYLDLEMRLGEGTGAAIGFTLMDAAMTAYTRMGTFGDAAIDQYVPQN